MIIFVNQASVRATNNGHRESWLRIRVKMIDIGAMIKQEFDDGIVSFPGSSLEWEVSPILMLNLGTIFEKQFHNIFMAMRNGFCKTGFVFLFVGVRASL